MKKIKYLVYAIFVAGLFFGIEFIRSQIVEVFDSSSTTESSYSHFVSINKVDEYNLVNLKTAETFNKTEFSGYGDNFVFGESSASITVTANYKYFMKLSELKINVEDRSLVLTIPKLRLSLPVAFDSRSISETSEKSIFGKDTHKVLKSLRRSITGKLMVKGVHSKPAVYEKAAHSLAKNMHAFFQSNKVALSYDEIIVRIGNKDLPIKFDMKNSYCEGSCLIEFPIGENKYFVFPKKNWM